MLRRTTDRSGPELFGQPVHPVAGGFALSLVGVATLLVGIAVDSVAIELLVGIGVAVPEYVIVSKVYDLGDGADDTGSTGDW